MKNTYAVIFTEAELEYLRSVFPVSTVPYATATARNVADALANAELIERGDDNNG